LSSANKSFAGKAISYRFPTRDAISSKLLCLFKPENNQKKRKPKKFSAKPSNMRKQHSSLSFDRTHAQGPTMSWPKRRQIVETFLAT